VNIFVSCNAITCFYGLHWIVDIGPAPRSVDDPHAKLVASRWLSALLPTFV
jgi:hypothetical protein